MCLSLDSEDVWIAKHRVLIRFVVRYGVKLKEWNQLNKQIQPQTAQQYFKVLNSLLNFFNFKSLLYQISNQSKLLSIQSDSAPLSQTPLHSVRLRSTQSVECRPTNSFQSDSSPLSQ